MLFITFAAVVPHATTSDGSSFEASSIFVFISESVFDSRHRISTLYLSAAVSHAFQIESLNVPSPRPPTSVTKIIFGSLLTTLFSGFVHEHIVTAKAITRKPVTIFFNLNISSPNTVISFFYYNLYPAYFKP